MANENNAVQSTKVITNEVRASYVHVFTPTAVGDSEDKKYSISLIIPKSDKDTLSKVRKAIEAAKEAGKASKFGGKIPPSVKTPLRDGDIDRPDDEAYENCYFINASCNNKPGVIDKRKMPITDEEEFYSGCYCKASITFFAFNAKGNKGIAAGLNNLLKTRDGESLGGSQSAESDFAEEEFDDEDTDF